MPVVPKRLAECITCHAWNRDGTKVAICPNNNLVQIWAKSGNDYKLEATLTEHDQVVTGIDWAPNSNRIVSCSQDRNAYVWTLEGDVWVPILVILRINRAATHVKWSPAENKFALSCGQKLVSICYFEEDNNWWVSKHIKKHKSTVLKVQWHPCNSVIVTASCDFKCRVFSAHIRGVDKGVPQNPWGDKIKSWGALLSEFDQCGGWVQSADWSPSGNLIAYCGQDSTMTFGDISGGPEKPLSQVIPYNQLPFRDILWVDENTVIGVGHNRQPFLFQNKGGKWAFIKAVDDTAAKPAGGPAPISARNQAFNVFRSKVERGQDSHEVVNLKTTHQNCVTCITTLKSAGGKVTQYCTTGIDGNICVWDANF